MAKKKQKRKVLGRRFVNNTLVFNLHGYKNMTFAYVQGVVEETVHREDGVVAIEQGKGPIIYEHEMGNLYPIFQALKPLLTEVIHELQTRDEETHGKKPFPKT